MGIEPTSSAWKADILADVLYPQLQNTLYHNFAQMSSMNLGVTASYSPSLAALDRFPFLSPVVTSSPGRGKSFLKGTPYGYAAKFIATTKSRPLGEGGLPRSGKTEGVLPAALSVFASQIQLSQRESPWHSGTVTGSSAKCAVSPEAPSQRELSRRKP